MSSMAALDPPVATPARPAASRADTGWPIVVVTTFFPSSLEPQRTVFVKNLVLAMRSERQLTVVSPRARRPWPSWRARALPRADVFEGIPVWRPQFFAVPGLTWLSGLSYFMAILGVLSSLRRQHGRFVLHAHCAYPDGVGVAMAARWLNLPCVITAHGSDINVYSTRRSLRPQLAWAFRQVSAVICVSQALQERVAALAAGNVQAELACIPCAGFDPMVFAPRDRTAARADRGLDDAAKVVVFVGQLVALKQVGHLIDAWGHLKSGDSLRSVDRLIVIGAGPEDARLKQQALRLGLGESVVFTGVLPQPEVSKWVAGADLLCLPSRTEGMPNVIVEALASGVPVVASRVGGIPELVVDDVNGYLVPSGDSVALAQGLKRCFDRAWNPTDVRRSAAHLTWGAIAARNLELIDRVTEKVPHASVV
jgi:teichuronic acid biosynthesis glycosyltransferase TuaC